MFVQVEEGLELKKLTGWMDSMQETTVSVHLPRFKVEDSFSLKENLQAMGLTDLFSAERASLPGEGRGYRQARASLPSEGRGYRQLMGGATDR